MVMFYLSLVTCCLGIYEIREMLGSRAWVAIVSIDIAGLTVFARRRQYKNSGTGGMAHGGGARDETDPMVIRTDSI